MVKSYLFSFITLMFSSVYFQKKRRASLLRARLLEQS